MGEGPATRPPSLTNHRGPRTPGLTDMSEIPTRKRKKPTGGNLHGPDKQIIQAETQERRRQALILRKQGATYEQIATQLKFSTKMVAWRYVHEAIADIPADEARDAKRIEVEKLDARELRLNQLLLRIDGRRDLYEKRARDAGGDPANHVGLFVVEEVRVNAALTKIAERRARLEGLDAPTRAELTGKDGAPLRLSTNDIQGMTDEQLDRVLNGARGGSGAGGGGARAPEAAPGEGRRPH